MRLDLKLAFGNPVVTVCTTCFNVNKCTILPAVYVRCDSGSKHLFPTQAVRDHFL